MKFICELEVAQTISLASMQITNDVACLYANMTLKTDDEDDPFWCLTLEPSPEAGKDSRAFLVPDLEEQERDNLVSRTAAPH